MEITCPSGLRGVVRRFKVADEAIVADAALVRGGRMIERLAAAVWTETLDLGPYTDGGTLVWPKTAAADTMHVVLQARIHSRGSVYQFKTTCASAACRRTIARDVDLERDLPYREMSAEMRRGLASGEWPTHALEDGRRVTYRCLLTQDNTFISNVYRTKPQELTILTLARRVVAIDGVGDHPAEIGRALRDLDEVEGDRLREVMDAAEGGYQNDVSVECDHCGEVQEDTVPFGPDFFSRLKRSSTTLTARTGSA